MLAIALGLGLASDVTDAAPKPDALLRADAMHVYIVQFEEPAAARFRGFTGTDGKGVRRPQLAATSPVATGAPHYDSRSAEAVAYVGFLDELREVRLGDAAARLGRPLAPLYTYTHALNGMAVKLTPAEASELATMPGVKSVAPEIIQYLQTDRGPQWIKADLVWSGAATGTARQGEGVIVGVIDSGIRRTHVSFSGTGITNPFGNGTYRGYCVANPIACNNKLIGLWDFTQAGAGNTTDPNDINGHGTHVAGTVVGNPFSIYSGVAPRANLIVYKGCPDDTCPSSATLASINQAVADGVHVINYSIGGSPQDPWSAIGVPTTNGAEAMLAAREAGIVVAAAAGNDGPFEGSHSAPGNSPWVMGVAAATHGRSGPGDRLASFSGRGPVIPLGVIKPDISGPGVQVNATGINNDTGVSQKSGTSMASPHVAGAAALVKSVHPSHSADEIISALMMTARNSVSIGTTPGNPHQQGAGMVDVSLAVRAGLYLDVPANGFDAPRANPYTGLAQNMNLPSLGHGACYRTCTLTRTFKLMPGANPANYSVQVAVSAGATMTPSVNSFTSSAAGQAVTFNINVESLEVSGKWVYGTVTLVNNSGDGRPNLKLPVAIFATPFTSQTAANLFLPVEQGVDRERGSFDIDMSGLLPLPSARFATTELVVPLTTVQNITQHPNPGEPYESVNLNYVRLVTVPAITPGGKPVKYRLRATTSAPVPDIDLFVGRDFNNDGLPSEGEELCVSGSAGSTEVCDFTVMSEFVATNYWVMAQNFGGAGQNVRVDTALVAVREASEPKLAVTGPGNVPENTSFKVRVVYDDPSLLPGSQRVGYVLVKGGAGDNFIVERPIVLARSGANSFQPFALANGVARAVTLPAGSSHDKLYFDVPPHATSVQFTTTGSTGNVDLYVARLDSPTAPAIAPAPAWNNNGAFRAATGSGNESITLSGPNLLPGRYYVVPGNPTGGEVSANVTATVTAQGARPGFLSGQYANPGRDGHGIFVDFAGPAGNPDQWVTVWYTYLEDNTPTWYYSQGPSPTAAGIWKAELFRVVWDGSGTHAVDVGDVIITETGTEAMTFNFNIDGQSGWEPMVRVGGGNCPQHNGQALDVSGHWYSPSLAGFGYTYQATGGGNPQEVFIPYVYDGRGVPRWLYGQKNFAAAASSFNLQWFSGFSPLAPRVNLAGTPAGTATRTLVTNDITSMSVNSSFGGALTGNWVQNLPVAQLSQRKNCQ
jgi:hypothetical protein